MKEQKRHHTIAVNPGKPRFLSFRQYDQPDQQRHKQYNNDQAAYPAEFLSEGTKDEIGMLLGNKIKLGLSALQIAFSQESPRSNGYFGLGDIPSHTQRVKIRIKQYHDPVLLMAGKLRYNKIQTVTISNDNGRYNGKKGYPLPAFLSQQDQDNNQGYHSPD